MSELKHSVVAKCKHRNNLYKEVRENDRRGIKTKLL